MATKKLTMNNLTCQPFIKTDESNLQSFAMFKLRFETFCRILQVNPAARNNQDQAKNMLILYGGDWIVGKCMEVNHENMTYLQLIDMLENQFKDSNPLFHKAEFENCKPRPGESLKDYVSRLRPLARLADMDNDESIILRIMQNCTANDSELRTKTIERNITLTALLEWQTTRERSEALLNEPKSINQIQARRSRFFSDDQLQNNHSHENQRRYSMRTTTDSQRNTRFQRTRQSQSRNYQTRDHSGATTTEHGNYICIKCNYVGLHGPEGCPAKDKECWNCKLKGHFSTCCPALAKNKPNLDPNRRDGYSYYFQRKRGGGQNTYKRYVRQVQTAEDADADDEYKDDMFECSPPKQTRRVKINTSDNTCRADLRVCGTNVNHVLDTGSDVDLMGSKTFRNLEFKPKLRKSFVQIVDYNKNDIEVIGQFSCRLGINGFTKVVTYLVVNSEHVDNIIGMKTLRAFNMVKFTVKPNKNQVNMVVKGSDVSEHLAYWKKKFPKLFEDRIGCIPNEYISIEVDPDFKPVQQPAYPCPFALLDGAKQAIEDLIKNDIIEEVPPGTKITWISPLHAVEKQNYVMNKKDEKRRVRNEMLDQRKLDKKLIRITSNNKCLNKAIVKQKRLMPNIIQLKQDLVGMKFFSKVDIKSAFNTLMLEENSRDLTIFSTPWNKLYRYKRLNMGLCIASELYQEKMTSLLADLKNIRIAIDDILVFGKTKKEEMQACEALLKRLEELNVTINEKSIFNVNKLTFFGMEISENGIRPNEHKLQALIDMPAPKNKQELDGFLGLATYFAERIIKFSEISEPLRELRNRPAKQFNWTPHHQNAFENVKKSLYTDCLGHFNSEDDIEIWVDASPKGIAAFLVQVNKRSKNDRRLIACASKSFTKSERNYSQVEREGYACVWAIEHFHLYVMGQEFKLLTDNKAIVQIFENNEK